jgi:hypothetical protein
VRRRGEPEALESDHGGKLQPSPDSHRQDEPIAGGHVAPVLSPAAVVSLQASAGNAAVTALLQRAVLADYDDGDPQHDPSRLSDAQIRATDEYKAYMAKNPMPIPMRDIEPAEATLACQLLLRHLRQMPTPVRIDDTVLMHWLDVARSRMAMTSTAEGTVGQEQWVQVTPADVNAPGAAQSDFVRWMLAGGNQPNPATGRMNCWEMVLFSAFRAGYLSEARMRGFYTHAKTVMTTSHDVMEFPRTLERDMRGSAEQTYDPTARNTPRPLRGDLVIFREAAGHLALATGQRVNGQVEVVSHWPPPDGKYTVKRTTVEALMTEMGLATAKFWGPSW